MFEKIIHISPTIHDEADANQEGKITAGEMQEYLSDKVSRQAMSISRKQETQLVGDANKVLMGKVMITTTFSCGEGYW